MGVPLPARFPLRVRRKYTTVAHQGKGRPTLLYLISNETEGGCAKDHDWIEGSRAGGFLDSGNPLTADGTFSSHRAL